MHSKSYPFFLDIVNPIASLVRNNNKKIKLKRWVGEKLTVLQLKHTNSDRQN